METLKPMSANIREGVLDIVWCVPVKMAVFGACAFLGIEAIKYLCIGTMFLSIVAFKIGTIFFKDAMLIVDKLPYSFFH